MPLHENPIHTPVSSYGGWLTKSLKPIQERLLLAEGRPPIYLILFSPPFSPQLS